MSSASTLRTVLPEVLESKGVLPALGRTVACSQMGHGSVHGFIREVSHFLLFELYLNLDYRYQERKILNEAYLL